MIEETFAFAPETAEATPLVTLDGNGLTLAQVEAVVARRGRRWSSPGMPPPPASRPAPPSRTSSSPRAPRSTESPRASGTPPTTRSPGTRRRRCSGRWCGCSAAESDRWPPPMRRERRCSSAPTAWRADTRACAPWRCGVSSTCSTGRSPLRFASAARSGRAAIWYRCPTWRQSCRRARGVAPGAPAQAAEVLRACGLEPLTLSSKEGLALVNGTSFMTGIACLATRDAATIAAAADSARRFAPRCSKGGSKRSTPSSTSAASPTPAIAVGDARATPPRGEPPRAANGSRARRSTSGSGRALPRRVQDRYSLRCAPQFIGALWDTLAWVERSVLRSR